MTDEYTPHVLGSYGFIGDGERGALIGPAGDIAWMCAPRWDSDAVFASLIGGDSVYAVTPTERFTWGGHYEPASLIWHSRWVTAHGIIECREALAYPAETNRVVVLRRIMALDQPQTVEIRLAPRGGFGRDPLRDVHDHHHLWTGRVGQLWMRWQGPESVQVTRASGGGQELRSRVTVRPAEPVDLVLELSEQTLEDPVPDAALAWRVTETAWKDGAPSLGHTLDRQGADLAYAVMRGLTSKTGGMVAAATTSLPERAEQGRNYDYRYVWIRDQAFAGQAVAAAGGHGLLDNAVSFITARLLDDGPNLTPAYRVDGTAIPDQRDLGLPGYPGGFDLLGNHVNEQFQLDAFGEALLLFAAAADLDRLDDDGHRAAHLAAGAIEQRRGDPEAGIWEIDNRIWTHSQLICVAGLRQGARSALSRSPETSSWSLLAERILADTAATSLHPDGHWQRSPHDPHLDGSLLLPALRGALPADDPRSEATLHAYLDQLTDQGYAYRFRHGELPLGDAEGSFVLCGFVTAMSLHHQGHRLEAARWFERTARCVGPSAIHGEEWDVAEHQLRGNLPQAFVHALHLEAAARLAGPPGP
ncbi:MAG: glycoside hydrolase family 15 protein [Actinomycetota bacterium]|nr:glycoside hydrolase family 15 protein [Actinomycetota bacterium]